MSTVAHNAPQQFVVQQPVAPVQPAKKYNVSYGQNGEVFYNGATVGNYYTSNIFEIGEDRFVENWARENGVELQPTIEWAQQNQSSMLPVRKENREADISEQGMMQTFGVTDAQRNTSKPGAEMNFNAPAGMLPMTQYTATQGMDQQTNQNVDTQSYGKGFSPDQLNPFFKK